MSDLLTQLQGLNQGQPQADAQGQAPQVAQPQAPQAPYQAPQVAQPQAPARPVPPLRPAPPRAPQGRAQAPQAQGDSDTNQLLAQLAQQVQALTAQNQAQASQAKRSQLAGIALSNVPAELKSTAGLALDGLLAANGINLDQADVAQLGPQLQAKLQAEHPHLFRIAGSKVSTIPTSSTGAYDFSGLTSLSEIPPGMMSQVPVDILRRLSTGEAGAPSPNSFRPRNRFH